MTSLNAESGRSGITTESSTDFAIEENHEHPETFDMIFEVLSNYRRRLVLNYLWTIEGQIDIGTLAEYVAGFENDRPSNQVSSVQRKRAYVALYQCHLPKMDSYNVIDYNQKRGTVSTGPRMQEAVAYLEHPSGHESKLDCSRTFGIGVGSIAAALLVFVALNSVQLLATGEVLVLAGTVASVLLGAGVVLTNSLKSTTPPHSR